MLEASKNAFKLYVKTRGSAARESYLRSKEILGSFIGLHPIIGKVEKGEVRRKMHRALLFLMIIILAKFGGSGEVDRQDLLRSISQFRPAEVKKNRKGRGGGGMELMAASIFILILRRLPPFLLIDCIRGWKARGKIKGGFADDQETK